MAVRLICPVVTESNFSLVPDVSHLEKVDLNLFSFSNENNGIADIQAKNVEDIVMRIFSTTWIVGMVVMIRYSMCRFLKVKRKIREAVLWKGNIYYCDHIDTPFILGVHNVKIYLPTPPIKKGT